MSTRKTYRNLVAVAVLSLFATTALGWDFGYDGAVSPYQLVDTSPDWEYGDSQNSGQDYDSILTSAEAQAGNAILDRNDDNSGGQPRFYGLRFGIVACDSEWPGTLKATLVIRCKNLETDYVGNPDGDINTEGKALLDVRDGASNRWNLAQTENNQWVLDCRNERASGRTDLRPLLVGEANDWHVFRIVVTSDWVSTTYTVYYDEEPTPIQTVTRAETITQLRFELSRSSDLNRQHWQIDWIRVEVGEAWSPGEGDQIPHWQVAWYVAPPPLGSDWNPGTVDHPFATVQRGIDAASHGDTVIAAQGTYVENIKFKGKNIVLQSTDPLDSAVVANTIIDGNQADCVVKFAGTEIETCVLSGFTIQRGLADAGAGIRGGTYPTYTHATIQNNVIRDNYEECDPWGCGGGLAFCDGRIQNNRILRNRGEDAGGGLALCHGTIQNNLIAENDGGGLADCNGTIQNNTIMGNAAKWDGGGLYDCNGTIQNNTITGNSGGGLYWCNGTIQNNTIAGNSGSGLSHCNGTMQNNAITSNSGAGLASCDGMIQSNTISGNSATESGGGLYGCRGTIRNCIIWGNTLADPQLHESSVPSFSCIENWSGGGQGNIASEPRFADPKTGDYHLQEGSPCIDAGANYYWFAWPQRDLDGNCRVVGVAVDMGCYEYGSSADADGDLLSDSDESAARTNPFTGDSDGDGLRDGLELLRGSNPLQTTARGILNVPSQIATVQKSLCVSLPGDEIIVAPGTYRENIQFCGAEIILRSSDPGDPNVVGSTILDGGGAGPVVSFMGGETEACVLAGFTIRNGRWDMGAGIKGIGTLATIQNNTITANSATSQGGGLYECNGVVQNNTIAGNSAEDDGGGLCNCSGTIQNNTITGNSGGALYWCNGVVQNNRITGNSAYSGGGLCRCGGIIQNNTITGNSARGGGAWSDFGGGLYGCNGTIQNNTITGNSAAYDGGGLAGCGGTIQNNTIAGNSAGEWGGGLWACYGTLRNCIIWGNTAPTGPQLDGVTIPSFSCIEGWSGGGEGNAASEPQFVNPEAHDYHVQHGSPCIDAGYNDPALPATDIVGMHRIMFGGKSLTVDMGAYEFYINDLTRGPNPNQTTFTWSSLADKTYSIFYSSDLLTWHLAIATFPSSGNQTSSWIDDGSLTGIAPSLVPRRFYRILENP